MTELGEKLQTIKNLVEVAIIIYGLNRDDLIPTLLELLKIEIDTVVEEHCVIPQTH